MRPQRLVEAARAHKAATLDDAGFRAVQDECIRDIVAFQESIGLPSVTDGEFRRRSWSAGFIDAVEGFGLREWRNLKVAATNIGDMLIRKDADKTFHEQDLEERGRK